MLWLLLVAVLAQSAPIRDLDVVVYVEVLPSRDGFIDPRDHRRDSLKDIQNRIRKTHGLRLAADLPSSDIVLTLMTRGVESERRGSVSKPVGDKIVTTPTYDNWLTLNAMMSLGDYQKEFHSGAGYTWGDAARFMVNDVNDWIKANRPRILANRQQH